MEKVKNKRINSKKETGGPFQKRDIFISLALIIILGFAVYANSIKGEFIWDDEFLVQDNVYIRNWSHISKLFTENIGAGAGEIFHFYRPLQMITYMIDYSIGGLNAKIYHFTNILLHISAALAIFWLMNILYKDNFLSLFTGILFVVHPIHTEAVSYVSGRADSLAALFTLLCFIFYIKYLNSESKSATILTVSSYVLAILSRENSLILPVLILLYHYAFKEKIRIKRFLPILSITFIYILLRFTAINVLLPHTSSISKLLQRIPGFFVAITNYIKLLFLPFHLHMEYGKNLFGLNNARAISGILIFFFLLFYAFKKRKGDNLIFFSVLWFFIALLPQSNIYPINAYMAEHWLYLPSIGFFLILARAFSFLYKRGSRIVAALSIAGLLAFYSYLTIRQNEYWQEPISFYEMTLKYAPHSTKVYTNLGTAYSDIGKKKEAIELYKKALEINPESAKIYNSLGTVYSNIGKKYEAVEAYKKAIEIDPRDAKACNNLGNVYNEIGKKEEAIPLYEKAIEIDPVYIKAYSNLGGLYLGTGKKEKAILLFKKVIEIDPGNAGSYNNLGIAYIDIGKNEEAIPMFKKAIEADPCYANAYNNLGKVYGDTGKKDEAIQMFKKAIEIDPGYAHAYNNLGNAYNDMGRTEEAIASYRKALEANPNYDAVYNNLAIIYYYQKQYDLAIKYCDKARELGFKVHPDFLKTLEQYR